MSHYFCFKRFRIRQDISAMKVNTDSVLLGSWASVTGERKIKKVLDIGTGTGVVALMIAQRLSDIADDFNVVAIDIDPLSAEEAAINFKNSPWSSEMTAMEYSLQDFQSKTEGDTYDLIVSNPPYFTDSLKAPSARRSVARHNDDLPFCVIIESSRKLLNDYGKLDVILPAEETERFIREVKGATSALASSLFITRICNVKTIDSKKEKRVIIELTKLPQDINVQDIGGCINEELIINEYDGVTKTAEYKKLTGDFYLSN